MSLDLKVGSMILEDLSTKCSIGSMIQSDPVVTFDSRSWIPLDPFLFLRLDLGSHRIRARTDGMESMFSGNYGSKWIPRIHISGFTLFLDEISTKSYYNACWNYI